MLKNYLLVTLRNLWRNKLYASVSIFGLALAISCSVLISLYIFHELSYDNFHEKKDRLYRVSATIQNTDLITAGVTSAAVGPTLKAEYPEVESYCRLITGPQYITFMPGGDKTFEESAFFYADSTFFDVFSFRLLEGDPASALQDPLSLVISEKLAKKYFGDTSAIGKTIRTVNKSYTVTGVIEDCPANSDIQYNGFISMSSFSKELMNTYMEDWFYLTTSTYVVFREHTDPGSFKPKLDQLSDKFVKPWSEINGGIGTVWYELQPITEIHLDNSRKFDSPKGNRQYLYIFGVVGIFILLIACINYTNLSLAQSLRRAREVGIRKTLGADRAQLIRQFAGEALVISFISLAIGMMLVEILLPFFNQLAQKSFTPASIFSWEIILFYSALVLFIGALSGSYPAFVLSSFQPVTVLKGIMPKLASAGYLRQALVVIQFIFSVLMILGTIVVYSQMHYMKGRDLGFDKESVLAIQVPGDTSVINRMPFIKQEMAAIPEVKTVSLNGSLPGYPLGELLCRIEQPEGLVERGLKFMPVDEHFLEVTGIELLQGRNLDPLKFPSDSLGGFLINETAAKMFGWEEPIGKRIQWGLMADETATNDGKVIGVVKDFHFMSLHNPVEPIMLFYHTWGGGMLTLKIGRENRGETLKKIEAQWKKTDKVHNFKYMFLDEKIGSLYRDEERMLAIFGYFSMISIIIACLGLFALTSYATARRTKEIGIRKVMGASVLGITGLIGKDFLALVIPAFLVAMPLGYYFLKKWLSGFAYHIPLHPVYFLLSAFIVILVASVAVSYNAVRAAKRNPVKALKYE